MKIFYISIGLLFAIACIPEQQAATQSSETEIQIDSLEIEAVIEPDTVPKMYLLGQFEPQEDSLFVMIEDQYSDGSGRGGFMHRDAFQAFKKMHAAAKDAGISLTILSPTRNFYRQKGIWERKWNGETLVKGKDLSKSQPDPVLRAKTILEYSSMPGTSRHHWGTDIDINAFENSYFESGKGLKEYEWLLANGPEYGFCQPYTQKGEARPNGYEEEKWHWSYTPVAEKYLSAYKRMIKYEDIKGFMGAETAEAIDVIPNYVDGINHACK